MHDPSQSHGQVYLVGAGPGDPRLMTLRAADCLARADIVLCDGTVDPRAVELAGPSAEVFWLDSSSSGVGPKRRWPLDRVVACLVDACRAGRTAVHLKDGDPELFSHGFEEVEALRTAGVPFEVVPGVTAATAAAALAEIPITHAGLSSAVALVTAQQQRDEQIEPLDFQRLGQFPGTLIVYMPANDPEWWSRRLIEGGQDPGTPVALVADVGLPRQRTVRCTLAEVAATMANEDLGARIVAVVGAVAGLAAEVGWYAARPLFGRRILVTRPRGQSADLTERLAELGAEVALQPAIEIGPPADWQPVDEAIRRLDRYDWVVFSSVNGVDYLLERLEFLGSDLRRLAGAKLAAIGPATAERLRQYRLHVALTPPQYRAESLADALAGEAAGKRFLLARASRGRELLAVSLTEAGAEVDQIVVYTSRDIQSPEPGVAETLQAGGFDWVTVTSSAIARALHGMFGPILARTRLASISPITSQTLREMGHEPAVEAGEYTTGGLLDAILNATVPGGG